MANELKPGRGKSTNPLRAITQPNQRAFILAYQEVGSITRAAEEAGIERKTHYNWMKDPTYRFAFKTCRDNTADLIEDGAIERAIYGTDKPIFYQGERVATVTEYDNTHSREMLRALRPEIYALKGQEINIINQQMTRIEVDPEVSTEEKEIARKLIMARSQNGIDDTEDRPSSDHGELEG